MDESISKKGRQTTTLELHAFFGLKIIFKKRSLCKTIKRKQRQDRGISRMLTGTRPPMDDECHVSVPLTKAPQKGVPFARANWI
mmetsp:Transcript_19977/g.49106  ORF Transcript_19977/g.49106 Transcript_19977/m.49106 type:complete len:84 (-) Transcript_19977:1525-1776(-)